jgi:hypothetical protein
MLNQWVDAVIDGLYTAGTTLLGYMVSQGGPAIPSKAAIAVALVTGGVGMFNQLRALRRTA